MMGITRMEGRAWEYVGGIRVWVCKGYRSGGVLESRSVGGVGCGKAHTEVEWVG